MIENTIQTFFLLETEKLWKSVSDERRPWGVWIREYKSLRTTDSVPFFVVPSSVWFLDKKGFSQKNPSEFQRFIVVQTGKYWCKSFYREDSAVFGRRFEIGLVSFGNIFEAENEYYFDFLFGGLFGRGYKYKFDEFDNPISQNDIWVS